VPPPVRWLTAGPSCRGLVPRASRAPCPPRPGPAGTAPCLETTARRRRAASGAHPHPPPASLAGDQPHRHLGEEPARLGPLPHAAVPIGLAGGLDPQQELRVLAPPAGLAELLAGGVAPVDALLALAVAARVDHERRRDPGLGAQLLVHGLGIGDVGLGAQIV